MTTSGTKPKLVKNTDTSGLTAPKNPDTAESDPTYNIESSIEQIAAEDINSLFNDIEQRIKEISEAASKKAIENLTIGVHNSPMENRNKISDKYTLIWTIVGTGVAIVTLIIGVFLDRMDISIKATEAIRDQTVAKTDSILAEIKSSNEKVLFELQGTRKDMDAFSKDIDNKLTIFKLQMENERMNNKLQEQKAR